MNLLFDALELDLKAVPRLCKRKTFMALATAILNSIETDEFFSSRGFAPESFVRVASEHGISILFQSN